MPSNTWTPLANLTLGANQTTVSFSSINQTYRDLVLVMSVKAASGNGAYFRLNSDAGSNYNWVQMAAGGSGLLSNAATATSVSSLSPNTNTDQTNFDTCVINLFDYSVTDKHKTSLARYSPASSSNNVNAIGGRWANTNAITGIDIGIQNGGLASGSTFTLYGISA